MGAGQLFFMLRIYRICCKCSRVNNRVALATIYRRGGGCSRTLSPIVESRLLGQLKEFPEKHFLVLLLFQLTSEKNWTEISHCFHFTMSWELDIYNAGENFDSVYAFLNYLSHFRILTELTNEQNRLI